MNFSGYLKSIRESKRWSYWELFKQSGIAAAHLEKIENGTKGSPKPDTIRKLSEALGVEYVEMLIKADALTEEDLIRYVAKARFQPLLNDEAALEVMSDRNVLELLEKLADMPADVRKKKIQGILGMLE